MNRLIVRLITSHVAVALLGVAATFLIVRQVAPQLFAQGMMNGSGAAMGRSQNAALRIEVADAVTRALVIGTLVGAGAAALFGALAAYGLTRPLNRLRISTRAMANGEYAAPVAIPRERELADLVKDVNVLGRALATTEERRVRLIGEIAHEMRTPLTVIDGYIEGMIDGIVPTTPAELAEVSQEVRRLRRLSESFSTLSRAEEGRLDLDLARVDLRTLVSEVVDRLRPQADDASVVLTATLPPTPVPARIDADRIAQVVTNLVGNAIRATPEGGRIEVSCQVRATAAVVEVADTGEGLSPEDCERVFERFYRVPGRRSDSHDTGSGIGLTIARGIARSLGGDVRATSPGPGRGARFTLELPGSDEPAGTS